MRPEISSRAHVISFQNARTHNQVIAVRWERDTDTWHAVASDGTRWEMHKIDILSESQSITVLAEFPLTLADLLPEDCREFRYYDLDGYRHAANLDDNGFWRTTGLPGGWLQANLDGFASATKMDLSTVVPLQAHADWIEAQR